MIRRYLENGEQLDLLSVRSVAEQSRADFEAGRIPAEYILELLIREGQSTLSRTKALDSIKEKLERFPEDMCGEAALVIADGLQLGERFDGSFYTGEQPAYWSTVTTVRRPHSFWVARFSSLSPDYKWPGIVAIGDIALDQFPGQDQKVYVGPLAKPWCLDDVSIEDVEDPDLGY